MHFRKFIFSILLCLALSFSMLTLNGAEAKTAIFTPTGGIDTSFSEKNWQEYYNNPLTPEDIAQVSSSNDNFMRSDYRWAPWVYYEWDYLEFWFDDIDVSDMKRINDVSVIFEWKADALLNNSPRTNLKVWNAGGWHPTYPLIIPSPNEEIYEEISVFDSVNTPDEVEDLRLRFKTATAYTVEPWAYSYHDYVAVKVDYTPHCYITITAPDDGYYDGEVLIEWEYSEGCDITHDFELNYKKGSCSGNSGWIYIDSVGIGEESYLWDSSDVGTNPEECTQYCVEIIDKAEYYIHGTGRGVSELFFVDNVDPDAGIIAPSSGEVGELIHFISDSTDNCGIGEYYWSFDDGGHSYTENADHAFSASGLYDVTLRVTDYAENSDIDHHLIDISYEDDDGPIPVKTVGKPRAKWDGSDSFFYPGETKHCWDESQEEIECWKVTIDTPINMDCEDDSEVDYLCYYVELDGDDVTSDYCDHSLTDGYCCVDVPKTIYFSEFSEHELEYFCVDEFQSEGPLDIEKFKVDGTAFEIQLNRKWNLISVPFVLFDNNIELVLSDVSDNVHAVWTYDPEDELCDMDWCVFSPDGADNDNLETLDPGWGYWIITYADDILLIGGSLFQPIVLPPSRHIIEGWNLIGNYGTEDLPGYYGPVGAGQEAFYALCSLGETWWHKGFTALITYWEPDNPYMWKELERYDNMDPGAGFWMFAPEEGIYSYVTACDWID